MDMRLMRSQTKKSADRRRRPGRVQERDSDQRRPRASVSADDDEQEDTSMLIADQQHAHFADERVAEARTSKESPKPSNFKEPEPLEEKGKEEDDDTSMA